MAERQRQERSGERGLRLEKSGIEPGACGSIQLKLVTPTFAQSGVSGGVDVLSDQLASVHQQQKDALERMIRALNPLAQAAARSGRSLSEFHEAHRGLIERVADNYEQAMGRLASSIYQAVDARNQQRLDDFTHRSQEFGFILAGAWYIGNNRLNETLKRFVVPGITIDAPDIGKIKALRVQEGLAQTMSRVNNFFERYVADDVYDLLSGSARSRAFATQQTGITSMSGDDGILSKALDKVTSAINFAPWLAEKITSFMNDREAPELAIMDMGHQILNIGWAVMIAYLGLLAITTGAQDTFYVKLASSLTGLDGSLNAIAKIMEKFWVIVLLTWFPMMAFGGTLAYYVPMVPYILWYFGIAGRIMMVVESVVAAPIWAAAHSMPEGEGIAGHHARNGYMLLLNVLSRPTLMLFGLYLAMLVMHALFKFLKLTFIPTVYELLNGEHTTGIVGAIFMIGIMVHMIVVTAHRSFELISLIAERAMRWLGGGSEQLGEKEAESNVRAGVIAAVHSSGTASQSALSINRTGDPGVPNGNKAGGPDGGGGGSTRRARTDAEQAAALGVPTDHKIAESSATRSGRTQQDAVQKERQRKTFKDEVNENLGK